MDHLAHLLLGYLTNLKLNVDCISIPLIIHGPSIWQVCSLLWWIASHPKSTWKHEERLAEWQGNHHPQLLATAPDGVCARPSYTRWFYPHNSHLVSEQWGRIIQLVQVMLTHQTRQVRNESQFIIFQIDLQEPLQHTSSWKQSSCISRVDYENDIHIHVAVTTMVPSGVLWGTISANHMIRL